MPQGVEKYFVTFEGGVMPQGVEKYSVTFEKKDFFPPKIPCLQNNIMDQGW